MDLTGLDRAIDAELRAAVTSLRAQGADEHLYAIAAGLVSDLTGFFVAGQTVEAAAAVDAEAEDLPYYWWSPSEWALSWDDPDAAPPGRVSAEIFRLSEGQHAGRGVARSALRRSYEERIVRALRRLRDEGALRNAQGEEVWVWVHYADAHDESLDDRSFARLQDASTTRAFERRFKSGAPSLTTVLRERMAALR